MTSDRALSLLVRENPIDEDQIPEANAPEALLLRERILLEEAPREARTRPTRARRRVVGVTAATASLAAVTAVAAFVLVGYPGGGPAVENAAAAVKRAAAATAASADDSGSVVVRITHDGELWAGTTIRWHDDDVSISRDAPQRGPRKAGDELRVVDGILYGTDPVEGGWIDQGSPANIDPDSGTTPAEQLAAVREDVEGATLARLGENMTGLTTTRLADGSTVYAGTVPAGQIAREEGFKEGEHIRVFPFGYVAHGRAADPAALLDAAITVGEDGLIRELAVTWETWAYTVTYSDLGTTPAVVAPKNAKSLLRTRGLEDQQQ